MLTLLSYYDDVFLFEYFRAKGPVTTESNQKFIKKLGITKVKWKGGTRSLLYRRQNYLTNRRLAFLRRNGHQKLHFRLDGQPFARNRRIGPPIRLADREEAVDDALHNVLVNIIGVDHHI